VIEDKQLLMEIMDEQELLMELEPKARMERVAELDAKVLSCLSEAQTLLNHHGDAALMPVTQLVRQKKGHVFNLNKKLQRLSRQTTITSLQQM
jgi:hypothetical protein